jgi:hypothetical protein
MSRLEEAKYRAMAGPDQAFGTTPQEALNALMQSAPHAAALPIIIWPYNQGDAFFTEEQQARLQTLKQRGAVLTSEEHEELERLIASAFDATIARTQIPPLVKS